MAIDPRLATGLAGGLNVGMKAYQAAPAISQFAQSVGQGALSGATSGAALQGLGGIAGAALPLAGSLAGADPETQGYLGAAGTALGSGLAIGGGALASGGVSGMAAAGAAGAGGTAAAGTAALVMAPIAIGLIVKSITEGMDASEAMFNLKHRAINLGLSAQAFDQMATKAAQTAAGIVRPQSPEQLASSLSDLNQLQKFYQDTGLESVWKGGGTSVHGKHTGQDFTAHMPEMQRGLDSFGPLFAEVNSARLKGQDSLVKAGWSPEQIQAKTGQYFDPLGAAIMSNTGGVTIAGSSSPSDPMGLYAKNSFNPSFRDVLTPGFLRNDNSVEGGFTDGPLTSPADLQALKALGMPTQHADGSPMTIGEVRQAMAPNQGGAFQNLTTDTPYGTANKSILDAVNQQIHPGSYETDIPAFLKQYGGVNPYLTAYGFGTPGSMGIANGPETGPSGEAGKAVGRLQPRNVITGLQALPRPEADARSEAVFGMRRPGTQGPVDTSGGQAPPPPIPGTSQAEPKPFGMTGGGFAVAPGGNIGTGGLVTQTPFGLGPNRANSGGL